MLKLGVNIDHVATLRQARYRSAHGAIPEPDPLWAAIEVELAGRMDHHAPARGSPSYSGP